MCSSSVLQNLAQISQETVYWATSLRWLTRFLIAANTDATAVVLHLILTVPFKGGTLLKNWSVMFGLSIHFWSSVSATCHGLLMDVEGFLISEEPIVFSPWCKTQRGWGLKRSVVFELWKHTHTKFWLHTNFFCFCFFVVAVVVVVSCCSSLFQIMKQILMSEDLRTIHKAIFK